LLLLLLLLLQLRLRLPSKQPPPLVPSAQTGIQLCVR
jgi:hypothetical protein